MRAVSLHLGEDVFVGPGDHVDVLIRNRQSQTSMLIEDVEVVGANHSTRMVTFLASVDDAKKTIVAEGEFRLRLLK
jgi:Flp pilus assembly protein CpaB